MSDYHAPLAVQTGWPLVVVFVLAVVVGVLHVPRYLQVLGIVVMEAVLLLWIIALARLP